MSDMSVFDPYVERFVPGRVVDNTGAVDSEGPVTSVVGETYYVSYAVERPPAGPGGDGEARVEILHQEEHDNPYDAGKAFGRMLALAPRRRKERAPEGADPVEKLAFEQDVESARADIIRMQVAIENNPELSVEEIMERGLDRPPEER